MYQNEMKEKAKKVNIIDFLRETYVSYRITCNNGNQRTLINS